MIFVFVKNFSVPSALTTWGLNEPCSHVAVIFGDMVYQSWGDGVGGCSLEDFNRIETTVLRLKLKQELPAEISAGIYQSLIEKYDDRMYDYIGLLFFIWRAFLFKFLGKPLPKKNPWGESSMEICCEAAILAVREVESHIKAKIIPDDFDGCIQSPYRVYLALKESGYFEDVNA